MLDRRWRLAFLVPLVVAATLYLPGIGQRILYRWYHLRDEAR